MLNPKEAPDGFTRAGMAPGWIRRKRNPALTKLREENQELKKTLDAVLERLEKLEEKVE